MPDRLDLSIVENDLTREGLQPAGPMSWLLRSYDAPDDFWAALLAANAALFPWPGKSRLHWKYDFFHDIIARNRQNSSPAFRWFREGTGWQELDYPRLGTLAAEKAARWEKLGACAGRKLCLVSPLNDRLLIAFLAALKIGMIVSLLPPWGYSFLRRRLDELTPDHVWVPEDYAPLLFPYRSLILEEGGRGGDADDARSHSYAASEPFALCFDPTTDPPHVPRELSADSAYLCAVRDGTVALGLKPGRELAAPGFGLMDVQPAMLLACLLSGATFVHVEESELARNPGLLAERPLRAVGITEAVRNLLLDRPVEVGKNWEFWFRDPAASQDFETWKDFIEALKLGGAFAGNQRWNASLGGCILFSVRRKGSAHHLVLPAAGVPWQLVDAADEKRLSLWAGGVFAVKPAGAKDGIAAGGMLAESRNEWHFLRPVLPGRSGRLYPVREVLDALCDLPFGSSCSMVEVPASRPDGSSLFILLVFAGGRRVNEASVAERIGKTVLRELGREFLPDRIQVVALHPRRCEDGSIDQDWCGREYLSGGIARRQAGEVYRRLTDLRDLIHFSRQE